MSKGLDLSGLDQFNSASFLEGIDQEVARSGKPLLIPLDQILPDPEQPRQEIDAERLAELTASIQARGVKSPISVKPKNEDGIFYINHGERRFRACQKAGLTEIPAFIDDDHNSYDQVIENIQRENLTPLEIAHFIERRLEAGDKKGQIAKILGKSASYVSDHAVFFEFPDFIRDLYDSGRCRAIQALALLHRSYKEFTGPVAEFCSGDREITTTEVRAFVAGLKNGDAKPTTQANPSPPVEQSPKATEDQGTVAPLQEAAETPAPAPAIPAASEAESFTPPATAHPDSETAFFDQLERFLKPLETYLGEVTDPEFRQAAAEKLQRLAAKFTR